MKFSIITVVYNAKKDLEKTYESVCKQQYSDFEYIIIDGNSTDGTKETALNLSRQEFIKVVSEKDNGIYDAMNKGIKKALGKYVIFMNAGDTFSDNLVLRKVSDILSEDIDILYGDAIDVYPGEEYGKLMKYNKKVCASYFIKGFGLNHQTVFAKKSLFDDKLFDDRYRICADKEWLIYQYKRGASFKYYDYPICRYDRTGVSSNAKNINQLREETKKILIEHFGLTAKMYYLAKAIKRKIQMVIN